MYGSVAAFACLETNAWSSNGSCSFRHIAHRGVEPKAVCCKQFIRSLASQKCSLRSEAVTLRTQTVLTILTNPLPLIRVYIHIYDSLRRKKRKQVPGIIQECILNDICRPYANKQLTTLWQPQVPRSCVCNSNTNYFNSNCKQKNDSQKICAGGSVPSQPTRTQFLSLEMPATGMPGRTQQTQLKPCAKTSDWPPPSVMPHRPRGRLRWN